jgi:hypothetical protein
MYETVHHWAEVISNTALSNFFQEQLWIVPTSQSIHIVCLSIVFASAVVISFRLLGFSESGRSISQLAALLVPWMYRALVVLLLTGAIQTIAEPMRQFVTPAFWWKMFMIVCVVALTAWFARTVRVNAALWDLSATRPLAARVFGLVSVGLWIGIIYCGRFIGYTYQNHG